MGALATMDAMSPEVSFNIREFLLSEDLLQQVVLWLPIPIALQCGRVSKAFSKATLAAARCALWLPSMPSHPPSVAFDHSYWDPVVANENSYGTDTHLRRGNRLLGTPCIDLRPGGDAVDCSSLTSLLGRVFPNGDSCSVERVVASLSSITLTERSTTVGMTNKEAAEPTTGEQNLPKGIAVRSTRIKDECLQQILESYGDALEVLDLAGCSSLSAPRTARSIARSCKKLVSLDLSGARYEGLGHAASPPSLLLNLASSSHHVGVNDLRDDTLTSLLASVGAGLEFLRLRDCAHITDDGIHAVASSCPKLRELDIATQSSSSNITERSLIYLSSARCAASLVFLGLRNRHRVGLHGGLFNLISQFPNLRRLDLAGLDCINDDALGTLASALSLTHIDLSRATIVSNAGVSALANGCPELEWISLHGTVVSDNSVTALCSSCSRLRTVNISMTRVTTRSLRTLAGKDSLRWVNLRCCPSFEGDDAFRSMENLRRRLSAPKLPRDRGIVLGLELPKGGQIGWKGSPLRRGNRKVGLDASLRGVQRDVGIERVGRGNGVSGFGHAGLTASPPGARDISKGVNLQTTNGNSSSGGGQMQPIHLPVGIGDLSLTGKQRGGPETHQRVEPHSAVDIGRIDNAEMVEFDWDAVPRGRSLGDLATWRGFRGLSGDLVKHVLCELHPFANVNLVGRRRSGLNPSRKNSHGYLVHTSKYALSWVEIEVDEQGCVV